MIDYGKLRKALDHLEAQYRNWQTLPDDLPRLMREAVAESVIQRFETAYDSLWKVLRRHLQEALGLPEVPASPKPVFRLAHENSLLPSDIRRWIAYANARIATAHDHSGEKAQQTLKTTGDFIRDAEVLYRALIDQASHQG